GGDGRHEPRPSATTTGDAACSARRSPRWLSRSSLSRRRPPSPRAGRAITVFIRIATAWVTPTPPGTTPGTPTATEGRRLPDETRGRRGRPLAPHHCGAARGDPRSLRSDDVLQGPATRKHAARARPPCARDRRRC